MSLNETDKALARERIGRLFRFLCAMQTMGSPPNVQLKSYDRTLKLNDLPKHKNVVLGKISSGEDEGGDDFILRVKKPTGKEPVVTKLFDALMELRGNIERESEKVELVVGDGILSWEAKDGPIDHPILLQKLQLEFDADAAEIVLRETDRESELCTTVLRAAGVEEIQIGEWRKRLQEAAVHPLGGADTTAFLQEMTAALWPQGSFSEKPEASLRAPKDPRVTRDPHIYLGMRSAGLAQALEAFLQALPNLEELPPSLVRVVGLDPGLPGDQLTDRELLLTMPANPEQERVARRLAATGAVLVQGPPGTGKTHTIANMIGHLLAQGKSILVTSHASKALRIVRDMVIPELRALCVSVLDQESESRDQLEDAVKGIVSRFTSSDPDELDSLALTYEARRIELLEKLEATQKKLQDSRMDEYRALVVGDDAIPPARAAQLLVDPAANAHAWLPGPVESGAPLPLTVDEIRMLYRLNREVPAELEGDLRGIIPALDDLIPESSFRELVQRKSQSSRVAETLGPEVWEHDNQNPRQLSHLLETCERAVAPLRDGAPWALDCVRVGMLGGAHRKNWEDLAQFIEEAHYELAELQTTVLDSGASITCDLSLNEQINVINQIIEHLRSKGSIGWIELNTKTNWKKVLSSARINNASSPKTVEDCEGVLSYLRLRERRTQLETRWERQMTPKGAPPFAALGESPEETCATFVPAMRAALKWADETWSECKAAMKEAGLRWSSLIDRVPVDTTSMVGELHRIHNCIQQYVIPAVTARRQNLETSGLDSRLKAQEQLLLECSPRDMGGILNRLRAATAAGDADAYSRSWAWFLQLHNLKEPVARRDALLNRLEAVAPAWADALRGHLAPHDRPDPPGDPLLAWRFRQWHQQISERALVELDDIQQEIGRLKGQLRTATANYVENKTWANQLRRTGVRQQQALVGWLDLMRKIGSGKGKRAPKLKATARERLADCRDAVPVWIMPLSRVAESYHPGEQYFDVVILDEASQLDVTGLMAFSLGKEVLVVGDHEQVSPEAVGFSYEKVEALIDQFLYDIPNKELYDGKTSVYDLARQSFGGTIRLLEHFRCVPEIIAFSNKLAYQGEIQPLRECSQVRLRPPTRVHRVDGGVYQKKVNKAEIDEIASLVMAACEQPEYAGHTVGVVSMVGEEQAEAIDKILMKHMALTEYHERRMLCGNAAQFQGDERDVMFLSLVDAPEGAPLSLRRTEVFQKRFNVAASRARDQLWVVTSLDTEADLKPGDLRQELLRHAADPNQTIHDVAEMAEAQERFPEQADAATGAYRIETALKNRLMAHGYQVVTRWTVGRHRLDLVVEGQGGRVAVVCDGDRENAPERFKQVMDRESVLERLGWRFIRLRASQYYMNPEAALQSVTRRVRELGIEPFANGPAAGGEDDGSALYKRICERAAQLRRIWRGEEEDPNAEVGAKTGLGGLKGKIQFSLTSQPRTPLTSRPARTPLTSRPEPVSAESSSLLPPVSGEGAANGGIEPAAELPPVGDRLAQRVASLSNLSTPVPPVEPTSPLPTSPLGFSFGPEEDATPPQPKPAGPAAPRPALPGWKDLLSQTRGGPPRPPARTDEEPKNPD